MVFSSKLSGWRRGHPRAFLLLLGLALVGGGAYPAARHVRAWQHLRSARKALARRDYKQAGAHLDRCLDVWPGSAEAHFLAARVDRRTEACASAERHLEAAERGGWSPEAVALERILARAQQGDLAEANVLQALVVQDHPERAQILAALAAGYLKNYELVKARVCLDYLLERDPDDALALVLRGEIHERLHRFGAARDDFSKALDGDPDNDDARLRLAKLLDRVKRPREAAANFQHLARRQKDNPVVVVGLARCREALGNPEEARRLLDALLAVVPGDAAALAERGRLALQAGDLDGAKRRLGDAVQKNPYEREFLYYYCLCLERLGKKAEAARWRDRLARVEADLARLKQAHQRALASPRDPEPRCAAGEILLRNHQDAEGLRWLHSALRCDPWHPRTHQILADFHERTGDDASAAEHRHRAGRGGMGTSDSPNGGPP